MTRVEALARRIRVYRKDPVRFSREVLCFEPDEWQCAVLMDLAEHPRVSVRSGQGVGKTGVEGVAVLWFLSCFPYARVVATAPTRQQLNDVLWAEIAKWLNRSPILPDVLTWTKTRVYVNGQDQRWFAVARTATKAENMQGFHEENMLFIIDEASGVAEPIMEAIRGTLSGINNKLLMCGNPTKTSGSFYDSHHADRASYRCHQVDSEKSPRTNKENIEALARKYGRESNVYRVRVLGDFPLQEDDVFIPLSLVENSIMTEYEPLPKPNLIHIGCDVARFGDDKTVIGYRTDEQFSIYKKRNGQDTMKTADDIVELGESLVKRYKLTPGRDTAIPVKIDDTGVGGGVTDRLRQLKRNFPDRFWWLDVVPIRFGTKMKKHKYYDDTTSYMMAVVKKLLQSVDEDGNPKPVELILPNDPDLVAQLSCRKYHMTENSKIKLESKKDMKKRDLPSPDEADCLLLVCCPVKPSKPKKGAKP